MIDPFREVNNLMEPEAVRSLTAPAHFLLLEESKDYSRKRLFMPGLRCLQAIKVGSVKQLKQYLMFCSSSTSKSVSGSWVTGNVFCINNHIRKILTNHTIFFSIHRMAKSSQGELWQEGVDDMRLSTKWCNFRLTTETLRIYLGSSTRPIRALASSSLICLHIL